MPRSLLLGQAVGVLACQCPDKPRLAVVDVAGRADRQRHARTAAATSSISSSASVRQSSSSLPSRTIPITGARAAAVGSRGSPRPRTRRTASSVSGSAPPPTRATVSSTEPPTRPARRSARARTALVLVQHAEHRHLPPRLLRVEVEEERSFERRQAELVDPQRTVQGMAAQAVDEVGAADDDPGLRASEELVAAEADEVGTVRERAARGRFVADVDEDAGAEVVEQRQTCVHVRRRRAPSRSGAPRSRRRGSSTGARAGAALCSPSRRGRSRRRECGSSSRPRPAARPSARARRGCGSRRRSRSARRARRAPHGPRPARRAPAASPRRCC